MKELETLEEQETELRGDSLKKDTVKRYQRTKNEGSKYQKVPKYQVAKIVN